MKRAVAFLLLCGVAISSRAQSTSAAAQPSTAPATAVAPTTVRLTLQDALARAAIVNNTIERSREDVNVAEANRQMLLSNVLPRVTATGNAVRNSTEVAFGGGSGDAARTILAQNDWSYRVVLSQPIYAGRREFRAYSQAKIGIENAREAERGTVDAILLRVASNYLAVVNSESRINVERQNIALAEKRRTQATSFYEAGEVTRVDVLRAETAIKAAQRVLSVAQQNRELAVSELRTDLDLDAAIDVVPPGDALPALPPENALVQTAETQRPDVALAANNLRIAALEIQKQRGFWLPTVTFDGGYISQRAEFPSPHYAYGALRFNIPLLQSGEVEARIALAKARELQARLDLENARVNAREDVRTALVTLHSAETGLGLAREQLAAAEAEYKQAFELYRAQESTSLDLASSEASVADARRAVAEETLNRDLAQLRVWYAAGALKSAVGVTSATPAAPAPPAVPVAAAVTTSGSAAAGRDSAVSE